MTAGSTDIGYVFGSQARREVLDVLSSGDARRQSVLDAAEASQSSVYDALNKLNQRGLVRERGDGRWQLTGTGRIVADLLTQREAIETLLCEQSEYWRRHDVAALPERFRRSLALFEDCEVIHSPETDPYRITRLIEETIDAAGEVSIVAPIYHDRHARALSTSDADRKRLIMTPDTVERVLTDEPAGPDEVPSDIRIRVTEADFAMIVTEETLLVSLPTLDGSYDHETELTIDSRGALTWGEQLFTELWEKATPADRFVEQEFEEATPTE